VTRRKIVKELSTSLMKMNSLRSKILDFEQSKIKYDKSKREIMDFMESNQKKGLIMNGTKFSLKKKNLILESECPPEIWGKYGHVFYDIEVEEVEEN
jgi:hypothetical protein